MEIESLIKSNKDDAVTLLLLWLINAREQWNRARRSIAADQYQPAY